MYGTIFTKLHFYVIFTSKLYLPCRSLQCNVRTVSSMHVLDPPGFQNPASAGKTEGALFDDLCHNYEYERLQKFFHDTVFTAQMERYSQVQIIDLCNI